MLRESRLLSPRRYLTLAAGLDDKSVDAATVTFEDDRGAYDQKDAAGFIRILGLPSRSRAQLQQEVTR